MTTIPDQRTTGPAKLPPAIFRHWIHSREEDRDTVVYRPAGFPFPPSFARDGFEVRPDGTFIQHDIAPTDGTVAIPGRWQAQGRRITVVFPNGTRGGFTLEIVDVDATVLRVRRHTRHADGIVAPLDEAQLDAYRGLPSTASFRLIDFQEATVVTLRSFPPQHVLRVSGAKPYANMKVELVPLVYVKQPEYWGIEVVGSLRGIGLPALAPYSISIPLAGVLGRRGVEVIGATRTEQFDIQPAPTDSDQATA